jgi:pimeloyl-ACP methyl ester carboxylesterase
MRLLYLHGFASGPSSKKAQFFRRKFDEIGTRLEVLDLAEGNFEELTISGQLAVIEREVRGEPVTLIGSSMGGYLAALYAARHSEVHRLMMMAPAFCFTSRWPESLGQEEMRRWQTNGWRNVFQYGEQRERRLNYGIIEDGLRYEDFPEFTQPGLIFHGTNDDVVPASLSQKYSSTHPNVRLELLDSGHELLDVLERIWQKTRAFLAE